MLDLAVASRIAHDLSEQQFATAQRGARRAPALTTTAVDAPRAPVRRSAVRALRRPADRLEPAPRCAPQA